MSILSFFSGLGHKIAAWVGSHQQVIQTTITDAKLAATAATGVATALGEDPSVLGAIAGISDGLDKASVAVAGAASATTLADHATNLAKLVDGLVSSGDIGVKNADTKAAIGAVLTKTVTVAGVLQTAANAAQ